MITVALKTTKLTNKAIKALQALCSLSPDKYSMPVNDGMAYRFYFPIDELPTIHLYAYKAGGRSIDLDQFEIDEAVHELDLETMFDGVRINRADVEFQAGKMSHITQKTIKWSDVDEMMWANGYRDEDGNIDELMEEHHVFKFELLTFFLINNPFYLIENEDWDVEDEVETLVKTLAKSGQLAAAA